ncbi:hypothetical protein [Thermoactinospora rubra]|uniref:hypothetical protein n=1 Tax=Thermoactinospora rubra TaxID=1088767 RepID=UPI000A10E44B|nr:hypothetical protein [Thermoactinospora rubra]
MDVEFVCSHAGRPAECLTRRDVARALLAVPSGVALVALPDLRRQLAAMGNPLSAPFWTSARTTLSSIEAGAATVGDVQRWLESTGTEPVLLTGGSFLWPEEDERGPVAEEMYGRLVDYLEERLQAGEIDPDALAEGDQEARERYERLQERWLASPLPDGRVPGLAVGHEVDEELFAAWQDEERFALGELRRVLDGLPRRPELPEPALREACERLRLLLDLPGYPGNVLRACAGFDEDEPVPDDDRELWLAVAAGVAGPISDLPEEDDDIERFADLDAELSHEDRALAALCSITHADWLAVVAGLVRLGPGADASPERIAELIAESEDLDADELIDLEGVESLFGPVVDLWVHLGVVDETRALTPLGWWGLPEALALAWS